MLREGAVTAVCVLPRGGKCCSPVMCECVRKNSTWLGTSMMINRETPPTVLCVCTHLASFVRSCFTLMKTQDWVETSVLFDNDI